MIFETLEDVTSAYMDMTIAETNTKFAQGDVIVECKLWFCVIIGLSKSYPALQQTTGE